MPNQTLMHEWPRKKRGWLEKKWTELSKLLFPLNIHNLCFVTVGNEHAHLKAALFNEDELEALSKYYEKNAESVDLHERLDYGLAREESWMKKTFEGWLFNRLEKMGGDVFNHVGCEGNNKEFIDFLTQFVPELGMKRKVTFTVETEENPLEFEGYKTPKDYNKVER